MSSKSITNSRGRPRQYPEIKRKIEALIERQQIRAGEAIPSEAQLSELFNISRTLTRRALSDLVKAGVLISRPGRGYFVAEPGYSLEKPSTVHVCFGRREIGMSVEPIAFRGLIEGIETSFGSTPFRAVWQTLTQWDNEAVRASVAAMARESAGVILVPMGDQDPAAMIQAVPSGSRAILAGRPGRAYQTPSVWIDAREAVTRAVDRLVEAGHQRIAYLDWDVPSWVQQHRREAFCHALSQHRIRATPSLHLRVPSDADSIGEAVRHALNLRPRPTALFLVQGNMLPRVQRIIALNDLSIPGDISLVSFDDSMISRESLPPVSVISLPMREMGRIAAEKLSNLILHGRSPMEEAVLKARFLDRDSVAEATKRAAETNTSKR